MKKLFIVVLVVFTVFAGTSCFGAGCSNRGCTARVKKIYPSESDGGRVFYQLKDVDVGQANCTPYGGNSYTLYKDHPMFDEYFAMTQLAAAMGKEIYFRIREGSNVCEIGYIAAYY